MNTLCRFPLALPFRSTLRQHVHPRQALRTSTTSSGRSIEVLTSQTIDERGSFPMTAECPAPTCVCGEMPTDLEIDYKKPLWGTMPRYAKHVVIRTAQNDWESRIEDGAIGRGREKQVNLARDLKQLIGPKGKYHDPYRNILVTNSSLMNFGKVRGGDVLIYPEGYSVTNVSETRESLEAFIEKFLLYPKRSMNNSERTGTYSIRKATRPMVLICGHNTRDRRCGVLGPLLRDEVGAWNHRHSTLNTGPGKSAPHIVRLTPKNSHGQTEGFGMTSATLTEVKNSVSVALISHVGGHAWAGNVIVYLPPDYRLKDGTTSPLAGKGVWYGRVEPKHVEGILEETVRKGRVIEELLRGVHGDTDVDRPRSDSVYD